MDVKLVWKTSISEKKKKKIDRESKNVRFLVSVNVRGSSGPIRFVVGEGDSVLEVIGAALKLYGREERLPQLGYDCRSFLLYPANADLDALNASELIGSLGMRNFILCKKEGLTEMTTDKRSNSWKAWLNKSLTFKISSH